MKIVMLLSVALILGCATSSYAQGDDPHGVGGAEIDFESMFKPIWDAKTLISQRKYAAAEKAYRALNPNVGRTMIKVGLGEAILGQKRFGEAVEMFESVSPTERASQQVPFQLRYAIALYAVGRRQEALDLYADSVKKMSISVDFGREIFPLSFEPRTTTFREFEVNARIAMAFFYLNKGNAREGLPEAERALYLNPNHILAQYVEAKGLLQSKPELAMKRFETLEKTVPDSLKKQLEELIAYFREQAKDNRIAIDAEAEKAQAKATQVKKSHP